MADSKTADLLDLWEGDCIKWRGRILTGKQKHYCWDYDGLPVDETTGEKCHCFDQDRMDDSNGR